MKLSMTRRGFVLGSASAAVMAGLAACSTPGASSDAKKKSEAPKQLDNGDKVGVQSETISRHSVTYFNLDGDNSSMGFPKSLTGFLKPYMKARFGQGLRL